MRKLLFITTILTLFLLGACGSKPTGQEEGASEKLKVVTTYSIIYDITKNVGGGAVEIYNLTPIGADPHEYDPLPEDVKKTTDADVVFYNGLNLEEGNGWFKKLIEVAGKGDEEAPVYLVSKGVEPILLESQGLEEETDPHAWLDLRNGIKYTKNIRDALIKEDPENENIYVENADQYILELTELHEKAIERISTIDENKRFLITSEGAFKYFGEAYGIETGYIWEINSENQGSPQQMRDVIDLVRDKGITSLFVETSVDRRTMETVSQETGVPIVGTVYTDSLGKEGTDGDTYLKMMESNINVIIEGLNK
ncbi:metal ABC transporter substrate-binding protein [Halalkalibacter akibai]|uniref:Manganese ABC transporter n=1 Tax=Halalkalibacter akibai (strain ATCC 43226 / DSM 21942 / CIP 109018 / JCM 9157 / 1139) TaxID=1236973 RepID=W4QZC5_HALA3|nr:metal ABC transporter substrate-binding protein [Halalkalibacter akibai]GAE36664.1 manganese ABC transporter [Halalkalibacter akibai JCM 9157]